ncbi:MAG: hypothetical protein H0X44_05160, partial [Acidobacteria bacterium]|nr:hypothetical protein [Acidobacteriota bacterium]
AYLDGYFLALDTTTSKLKVSDLLDGATWNGLRVAQRTAGADKWRGMAVVHRDIWLWGSQSTEVWYNAGLSPMPFASNPNAFIEQGIGAPFSWARVDSTPIWFTANEQGAGQIVRANGYGTPSRISTHAIESAIQGYSTTADAEAYSYQDQGHAFYVLTFPTVGVTWVYDAATNVWHQRMFWNAASATEEAWRPRWHASAFNRHLTLDRSTGNVYALSVDTGSDVDGAAIRRIRRCPHLFNELKRVQYARLQIDMETGIGLSSGQGVDPQVMLRWSDDGGRTWGHEHWASAGRIGQYATRVFWTRLGTARDRVFEVSVTDPVSWRMVDAYLEVAGAAS